MSRTVVTAALLLLVTASCRPAPEQKAPLRFAGAPVIIISIDTLRADRLPMFGYRGVETPHLDRFRRDAILFRNAWSHVPLTLPSHASLLTGMLPYEHNVRNNIGYALSEDIPTLQRVLKANGYATGAAVSAFVLRGSTGIARDFDDYDDAIASRSNAAIGQLHRPGRITAGIASRWIGQQNGPLFYLLHLFEPHSPYEPEEVFRRRYRNAYDGEIATVDAIAGEFLDGLRNSGLYDKAIIVVLADHGEGLDDHGETEHGIFVYREALHIPLLLKLPRSQRGGETVDAPAAIIDVPATIVALTGANAPAGMRGRSLVEPLDSGRTIYGESLYPRIHLGWSELRSLAGARHHYIEAPRAELYDMARDAREKKNVIEEERRVASRMRQELASHAAAVTEPGAIDPEEAKKLAALGYLSSPAGAAAGPLPDPKDRIHEIGDMMRASSLLRDGRWDAAAAAFRAIVETNPRLSDAWNQLGTALESAGRFEEAADVYKQAIQMTPELAGEFGLRRGSMLLKLERYDEAEQHARLAEATNAGAMHVLLGRIELARKNFGGAEAQARAASNDANHRISGQLLLAQTLAQQGRAEEALPIVEAAGAAIEQQRLGAVESYEYVRGDVLGRLERYDEAIEAFRREIEHFPRNQQAYANLYLVYMLVDRPRDAQKTLEAMVKANPGRPALLFAARTVEALGDKEAAERWQRRAQALK